ncbi:MAG TPA: sterol carrier family protein [Arachnia sp.]|nr:sterol carrier family protein [Arachnia sp.]HMT85681.1 sterol carrier family protein [Arachnia sp.]
MVKPSPALIAAVRPLLDAAGSDELDRVLGSRKPDLTDLLLRAARDAPEPLERIVLAAACRAACARLRERHPGATIEVRVPPYAAVQVGFGTGSRHTRGTPPNVVEFSPEGFLALATGRARWDEVPKQISGVHADEAAVAFPLL